MLNAYTISPNLLSQKPHAFNIEPTDDDIEADKQAVEGMDAKQIEQEYLKTLIK